MGLTNKVIEVISVENYSKLWKSMVKKCFKCYYKYKPLLYRSPQLLLKSVYNAV